MLLPGGGVFCTTFLYIGASLVSYHASVWRGGLYTGTVGTEVLHYDARRGINTVNWGSLTVLHYEGTGWNFFIDTMLLPGGGVFYTALLYIGASLVSCHASVWRGGFYTALFYLLRFYIMVKKEWTNPNSYYMLIADYTFFIIGLLLYWLSLGFSMASSRGSCRESYPSFLNSYKSPAQGLAMLKSRHIPASETRRFDLKILPTETSTARGTWSKHQLWIMVDFEKN